MLKAHLLHVSNRNSLISSSKYCNLMGKISSLSCRMCFSVYWAFSLWSNSWHKSADLVLENMCRQAKGCRADNGQLLTNLQVEAKNPA
jgi:hypothetical protein